MRLIAALPLLASLVAASPSLLSTPDLGQAEGRCRPNEPGPEILIHVEGIKDQTGELRAELYPPDDADFLGDDNRLVAEHKTFRRVVEPTPPGGSAELCLRAPRPGVYTLAVIHDRDGKRKFSIWHDGIGFPGNPKLGHSKPHAAQARITVGPGITRTTIVMNYLHGLFSFSPIGR